MPSRTWPIGSPRWTTPASSSVTLAVPDWPERLRGRSGYLVPKPVQRLVTAASFGSQKWSHWQGDGEVLRVSLGRDGLDVLDRSDDDLVAAAVAEVGAARRRRPATDGGSRQPLAGRVPAVPAGPPRLARRRRRGDAGGVVPDRRQLPRHRRAGLHRRRRGGRRCRQSSPRAPRCQRMMRDSTATNPMLTTSPTMPMTMTPA